MSRNKLLVRVARTAQQLPLGLLHVLEKPFRGDPQEARLLFLIALPRSGSTVAYQAIIHATDCLYLSNFGNLLYFWPLLGGKLSQLKCANHASDFRSELGFVDGPCGPAEGLKFWSYWAGYGLEDHKGQEALPGTSDRLEHLRQSLGRLCAGKRTFVSGYVGHCLVVNQLAWHFPGAVFVRLVRDPLDNAMSILKQRLERPGQNFSVTPRELGNAAFDPYEAAAAQVFFLNRRVDSEIPTERTIRISYEALCVDPNTEVNRVVRFCDERGFAIQRRLPLPRALAAQEESRTSHRRIDIERLSNAFARLHQEFGP